MPEEKVELRISNLSRVEMLELQKILGDAARPEPTPKNASSGAHGELATAALIVFAGAATLQALSMWFAAQSKKKVNSKRTETIKPDGTREIVEVKSEEYERTPDTALGKAVAKQPWVPAAIRGVFGVAK